VHRSRPMALLAWLMTLGLLLTACGGATPTEGGDAGDGDSGEPVSLANTTFTPSTLTIPAGTSVTFTDGAGHTVSEGSDGTAVDDPIVDEEWNGEPIVVMFEEAGTYQITCRIHPTMSMTITVEG
jgi:plastocyanin